MKKFLQKLFFPLLFLFLFAQYVHAVSIFQVYQGGTGVGTITGIPYGTGTSPLSTVTIGSGLNFSGGTLTASGSGGTVTSVSVATANGFSGTVANATTTPAITLSTSITGILKGNGTAISVATAGTDYLTPTGSGSGLSGIPTSVSNSDGTLTISPTTGAVVASLALGHANTWTAKQILGGGTVVSFTDPTPLFTAVPAITLPSAGIPIALLRSNAAPVMAMYRIPGSYTAPTGGVAGTNMGGFAFGNFDGTNIGIGAQINGITNANWTTSDHSGYLQFLTVPSGSTGEVVNAILASNGTFSFNNIQVGSSLGNNFSVSSSGNITSTVSSGNFLTDQSGTTGNLYSSIANSGGNTIWGLESSVGGTLLAGAPAYSTVFGNEANTKVVLGANSKVNLTLNTDQSSTFANNIDVQANAANSAIFRSTGATGGFLTVYDSTNSATRAYLGYGSAVTTGAAITDATLTSANGGLYLSGSSGAGIYVNSTGAVGIGTASPVTTLDVGGKTSLILTQALASFSADNTGSSGIQMRNINSGTSADFRFTLYDDLGTSNLNFSMPSSGNTVAAIFGLPRASNAFLFENGSRGLGIGTINASNLTLGTNNAARMTIDSTGNVGIGTTTPNYTGYTGKGETIAGNLGSGGWLELATLISDSNARVGSLGFVATANTSAADGRIAQIEGNTTGVTANNRGGNIIFRTKADGGVLTSAMTIDSTQSVSIAGALSISGNLTKINGATTSFPSSNSAGILTNDGSGNLTWNALSGTANYQHTIFMPTTGNTVNLMDNKYNIINPSGALLALTVALPSSPANNDVVYIKFTQNVTTVTYSNGTVVDGITAPTAGGLTVLTYDAGTTSWY